MWGIETTNRRQTTGRVDPAELTRGRVDSGSELVSDRVDPLPINISLAKNFIRSVFLCQPLKGANLYVTELRHMKESPKSGSKVNDGSFRFPH